MSRANATDSSGLCVSNSTCDSMDNGRCGMGISSERNDAYRTAICCFTPPAASSPDPLRGPDEKLEFAPLSLVVDDIAVWPVVVTGRQRGGEAALRRDRQLLDRDVLRGPLDRGQDALGRLELGVAGADDAEHDRGTTARDPFERGVVGGRPLDVAVPLQREALVRQPEERLAELTEMVVRGQIPRGVVATALVQAGDDLVGQALHDAPVRVEHALEQRVEIDALRPHDLTERRRRQ